MRSKKQETKGGSERDRRISQAAERRGGGLTIDSEFLFFFQAEDGIRDKLVTGVQTCALPISPRSLSMAWNYASPPTRRLRSHAYVTNAATCVAAATDRTTRTRLAASRANASIGTKIGRASCRERV